MLRAQPCRATLLRVAWNISAASFSVNSIARLRTVFVLTALAQESLRPDGLNFDCPRGAKQTLATFLTEWSAALLQEVRVLSARVL